MRMEYRKLGTTDVNISVISLGTWGIGGEFFGETDEQEAIGALQAGLDNGMNLIDTAPVYGRGESEKIVGKALKGGYRKKCLLATKCGLLKHWTQYVRCSDTFFIRDGIEGSLRRLQTDVIDLCQLHYPDTLTPIEATIEELLRLKQEGKIRYVGVSNFSVEQMRAAKACGELVSLQPKYSMIDREIEAEILPFCVSENIGILTYGSLGGGILTGKYTSLPEKSATEKRWSFYKGFSEPGFSQTQRLLKTVERIAESTGRRTADIAIAWTTHQKGVTTALVGVKNARQAAENASAGEVKLTKEQAAELDRAYKAIFENG
jgi:aryl-alcohol dehydrogenase-like predicted oxidoreductase